MFGLTIHRRIVLRIINSETNYNCTINERYFGNFIPFTGYREKNVWCRKRFCEVNNFL